MSNEQDNYTNNTDDFDEPLAQYIDDHLAQNVSNEGLRVRAEKFMEEKLKRMVKFPDDVPGWMADFAQQIREEDCKVVCDGCDHPESMKVKSAELSPSKKTWVHYFIDGNGHFICDAAAIRNLAEKEKEKEKAE